MALRRLAVLACAAALGAAGITATAGSAHADGSTTGSLADQLAQVQSLLGDGTLTPQAQAAGALGDTDWTASEQSAIDGSQYSCGSTELYDWLGQQAGPAQLMSDLSTYHVFDFAQYYATYYGNDSTPQSLGPNGEDTTPIHQEFKSLQKFWDVDGSKVQLVSMKGSILDDESKVAQVVELLYGVDQATADQVAPTFMDWAAQMPGGTDNPYFSFNLFAMNGSSIGQPDKIIVGDGVPDAFDALGLGMGVRIATAHEYGHIVQNKDGLRATTLTDPAEVSRRLELMADAEGSYYLTSAQGAAINDQRVESVARTMYDLGDCNFASTTHHGTPDQREASVEWAAGVANAVRPQSSVMTGVQFGQAFDQELPTLVAPDAS
ncbi:MAG: hypothetical protein FWE71_14680 [Nocardioidaceae bacterium]|nr:hypothetical protein [Nocardioidaceae bacterium]MCL2615145.1 hypothetical protein [Nocardioidaceae bacterium]